MVESHIHTHPRRQLVGVDGDKRSRGTVRPPAAGVFGACPLAGSSIECPLLRYTRASRRSVVCRTPQSQDHTQPQGEIAIDHITRALEIAQARHACAPECAMIWESLARGDVRAARVRRVLLGCAIGRQAGKQGRASRTCLLHSTSTSRAPLASSMVHAPCFCRSHSHRISC